MHRIFNVSRRGLIASALALTAGYRFFSMPQNPVRAIGPHEDLIFTPLPLASPQVADTIKLLKQLAPAAEQITSISGNKCGSMSTLSFYSTSDVTQIREFSRRLTDLGIDNTFNVDDKTICVLVGISELHRYLSNNLLKENPDKGTLFHPVGA